MGYFNQTIGQMTPARWVANYLSNKSFSMKQTVIITGASSGYGRAMAIEFAKNGWNVIATMRSPEREEELTAFENILVTAMDVQYPESIRQAICNGLEIFHHIDVLINNAGVGLVGVFESIGPEQIEKQFAVNVFGYMNAIREILPLFRKQGKGMIVNIGSQGGLITFPLMSPYHATKFALEGFTESLSYELASINVKVKLIEPGGANTAFFKNALVPSHPIPEAYSSIVNVTGMSKLFEEFKDRLKTPEQVAEFVYNAVTDDTDRLRYMVGDEMNNLLDAKKALSDQSYVELMRKTFTPKLV